MSATVVLMYHRVGAGSPGRAADAELYTVSEDDFAAQLDAIDEAGAEVVDYGRVVEAALRGEMLPARSVALSFDDGHSSDHELALPALLQRGHTAAFFITPAFVGSPGYLSWDQVRELDESGMTVGAHGLDHTLLTTIEDDQELERHLRASREAFTNVLGRLPETMSLPGGAGGARAVAAARRVGFKVVADSVPRPMVSGAPVDTVPRIAVRGADRLEGFRALIRHQRLALARHGLRYTVLTSARRALGESGYQSMKGLLLKLAGRGSRPGHD